MADLNYYGLAEQIQAILRDDPEVLGATRQITIMEEGPHSADEMPWVGIYYSEWEDPGSPIAAGRVQRARVTYDIWVYAFDLNGLKFASQAAQEVLRRVKIALMAQPTLGGRVESARVTGGAFESANLSPGFVMGTSIKLRVEALART